MQRQFRRVWQLCCCIVWLVQFVTDIALHMALVVWTSGGGELLSRAGHAAAQWLCERYCQPRHWEMSGVPPAGRNATASADHWRRNHGRPVCRWVSYIFVSFWNHAATFCSIEISSPWRYSSRFGLFNWLLSRDYSRLSCPRSPNENLLEIAEAGCYCFSSRDVITSQLPFGLSESTEVVTTWRWRSDPYAGHYWLIIHVWLVISLNA